MKWTAKDNRVPWALLREKGGSGGPELCPAFEAKHAAEVPQQDDSAKQQADLAFRSPGETLSFEQMERYPSLPTRVTADHL